MGRIVSNIQYILGNMKQSGRILTGIGDTNIYGTAKFAVSMGLTKPAKGRRVPSGGGLLGSIFKPELEPVRIDSIK
jgi:hypothetical protein